MPKDCFSSNDVGPDYAMRAFAIRNFYSERPLSKSLTGAEKGGGNGAIVASAGQAPVISIFMQKFITNKPSLRSSSAFLRVAKLVKVR